MFEFCALCGGQIMFGQTHRRFAKYYKLHWRPSCEDAKVVVPDHPIIVPTDEEVKWYSRHLPRLLGSEIRRTREDRNCYYCPKQCSGSDFPFPIYSGDEYVREAWVVMAGEFWEGRTRIEIRCRHYPECPWPHKDPPEEKGGGRVLEFPFRRRGHWGGGLKRVA
jgi:hypothetical protein